MVEDQQLVQKYGKPMNYDRNFRGPMYRNRSCTDVPCLLIFLIFLGGWGFISQFAIRNGDLNKLMVPTDSLNQKCGMDSMVLDKPYLFLFNLEKCIDPIVPLKGCPTPQVCVKSCPTETFVWDTMKNTLSFEELKKRLICQTEADKHNINNIQEAEQAINKERCARWYLKSAPFLNRCMWEFSPQVCDYIPSFLLKRNRRARNSISFNNMTMIDMKIDNFNEAQLQSLALTMFAPEQYTASSSSLDQSKQNLQEEPAIQCRRRTILGETTIKDKMRKTDTRLAKFVGNMVQHFYNGTQDAQQLGEAIVEDISNSIYVVLIVLAGTLVASLIFIALMRWLAAPILWFSICGVLIGLIVGIYFSVAEYNKWRNIPTVPHHSFNVQSAIKNIAQESNTWLYLSIFLSICFVLILFAVIILRKQIRIAIALTKEGSKAVSSVISTVFFPICSWILFMLAIVFAITIGLYLGSIGEPTFRMIPLLDPNTGTVMGNEKCICDGPASNYTLGASCQPNLFEKYCYVESPGGFFQNAQRTRCSKTSCSFLKIDNPQMVMWFIAYNIFGYVWISFFISAFTDMVLAATFATWYWTFKKKDVPYFTLTRAISQTLFYHLGTLAFGSLILSICRIIRVILEYIDHKLKKYDNAVTRAILCFLKCFFWLLETFLKFLSKNAYIMCAIHGKNFCSSAKNAFNLVMRNFLRVITLDKVTDFLFFLSKILLTATAATSTYLFFMNYPDVIQIHYIIVPTVLVVIGAFLITSVFFSVYSMAVDTLFLCFLEDCERNDGTEEKPYFMSKSLKRILGKHNQRVQRLSNNN